MIEQFWGGNERVLGPGAEIETRPHHGDPCPWKSLPSSRAHQEMQRTAGSPPIGLLCDVAMATIPMKTDDRNNNMRCNHQGQSPSLQSTSPSGLNKPI